MTVTIPPELEDELRKRATQQGTTMDDIVREALDWYLRTDPELIDELTAWQEVRDEAWRITDETF